MKRDTLFSILTTALTFSLMVFLSCAHQRSEDEDSDFTETVSEETVSEGTESAEAPPSEDVAAAEEVKEAPQEGEAPPAEEAAPTEQVTTNEQAPESPTEASTETQVAPPEDATASTELPPADTAIPPADVAANPPPADMPPADMPPVGDSKPLDIPSSPVADSRPVWSGTSSTPKIAKGVVSRAGDTLNRFYVLRKGDKASSLSDLIYGNPASSSKLKKWNKGEWKAGRVVYYQSSENPDDREMRSFYQERNVSPEEYSVHRGDWLSRVAKAKYGDAASWKEIAIVNGLESPDAISPGQKLAMYPVDLSGYSLVTKAPEPAIEPEPVKPIAQAPPMPVNQKPIAPPGGVEMEDLPTAEAPAGQAGGAQAIQPPDVQQPAAQVPPPRPPAPKKPETKELDIAELLSQNALAVGTGLGIVLLLLALVAVKRRKSGASLEEFDDGNAPTAPRIKRK